MSGSAFAANSTRRRRCYCSQYVLESGADGIRLGEQMKRTLFTGALALGLATAAGASGIGNYDAFWAQHDNTSIAAQAASPHYESALRGSTFLWADRSALAPTVGNRSEEHTSELQSLMRSSYAVFCLKKKTNQHK